MLVEIPPERPKVEVVLDDGKVAILCPMSPNDRQYLVEGLGEMSLESRFSRFGQGRQRLTQGEWDYLSDVDQHRHVAWAAVVEGHGAGVGRYIETEIGCAEVAVTVLDTYQRRGVGRALLMALVAVARADGLAELCFEVVPGNDRVIRAMRQLGADIAPADGLVEGRVRPDSISPGPLESDFVEAMTAFRAS